MITRVRFLCFLLAFAALSALSGCASVLELDDALAAAPYRIDPNGRIVVDTHINDSGPFDFVLDTGSSISAVFGQISDALSLDTVPDMKVIVHGAVASGTFPLLDVERVNVAGATWPEPRFVRLPGVTDAGAGIDGILGLDFLQTYAVGFVAGERIVRLYKPETVAKRTYRGWASIPFKSRKIGENGAALLFIDVTIDGWEIPAVFDLGAGLNMINWSGAGALGIQRERLRLDQVLSGALQGDLKMARLDARVVRTAGVRWRNEAFAIADLDIFEIFGLEDSPAAILGAALFTQRDFVIDFARRRLLVNVSRAQLDHNLD